MDERGQMVLPKEIRDRARIRPGRQAGPDLLGKRRGICCFTLVKADYLAGKVKDFLEPIMKTSEVKSHRGP